MALIAIAGLTLVVAACGGSSGSSESSGSTEAAATTAGEGSDGGEVDVSGAKALITPYVGKPTAFPVDEPLKEAPAAGTTLSQLQFGTPTGALVAEILKGAAALAGVHMNTVKAGASASETQAAATTILSQDPDAILLPASEPSLFSQQLEEMKEKGIPVASAGIMYPEKYGIEGAMFNQDTASLAGEVMAGWVVADAAADAEVLWIETPELSFNGVETESFLATMEKLCPGCTVDTLPVPASEVGSSAPGKIVSYLQANPGTEYVAYASVETTAGLPAALKTAGLEVKMIGWGTDPQSLEYLANGELSAMFAFDAAVMEWTTFDEALRLVQGIPLTAGEKKALPPVQLIEQKDVEGKDISKGFSAYPEFAERFAKLWKVSP